MTSSLLVFLPLFLTRLPGDPIERGGGTHVSTYIPTSLHPFSLCSSDDGCSISQDCASPLLTGLQFAS